MEANSGRNGSLNPDYIWVGSAIFIGETNKIYIRDALNLKLDAAVFNRGRFHETQPLD
jgi:hypothetical protein